MKEVRQPTRYEAFRVYLGLLLVLGLIADTVIFGDDPAEAPVASSSSPLPTPEVVGPNLSR